MCWGWWWVELCPQLVGLGVLMGLALILAGCSLFHPRRVLESLDPVAPPPLGLSLSLTRLISGHDTSSR